MLSTLGSIANQNGGFTYKRYASIANYTYGEWSAETSCSPIYGSSAQYAYRWSSQPTWNGNAYVGAGTNSYATSGWSFINGDIDCGYSYTHWGNLDGETGQIAANGHHRTRTKTLTGYSQGSYVDTIVSPTASYPANGRYDADGYWYVLQQ